MQAAAAAAAQKKQKSACGPDAEKTLSTELSLEKDYSDGPASSDGGESRTAVADFASADLSVPNVQEGRSSATSQQVEAPAHQKTPSLESHVDTISHSHVGISDVLALDDYTAMNGYAQPSHSNMMNGHSMYEQNSGMSGYSDMPFSMATPSQFDNNFSTPSFANSALPAFSMETPVVNTPGWATMPNPMNQFQIPVPPPIAQPQIKYPVLRPLLPHLNNIVSIPLACELLDLYFSSSSSAQMHPLSPYVLGFVFRKRSFLHPAKPRQCTPALLASILWVAAQTCDATFLTTPPSTRGRICQKLLELTVKLLNPLIHGPRVEETNFANTIINGVALGGLGVAIPGTAHAAAMNGETTAFGAAGALDDVVTYIHLATVVSASEYKGASLRWWNAAWALARELKLGRELPDSASMPTPEGLDTNREIDDAMPAPNGTRTPGSVTEEDREERRRIWWLVYTVDRHLSLCYNKPLFLLDVECDGLLQPMDDTIWQQGEFYTGDSNIHINSPNGSAVIRKRGPNFECTGHSIFGYFLPLMTILGAIVDLNHARNHPRFGVGFRSSQEWNDFAAEITMQLEAYGRSLKEFEQKHLSTSDLNTNTAANTTTAPQLDGNGNPLPTDHVSPSLSVHSNNSRMSQESDLQTRIVVAYGTHVMHVLHILLTGKWDPISLLDDNDLWISSQSFITATGHAVSAAEAIESILDFDPGLEFMPFFFGVYLLQGSFLLLLIADKLQSEASPSVVKACETIVRAHEACVATLNTEYQRNFRKVMRSALAQVRGRLTGSTEEQQLRRREVLSLYRWTGDGTGLAL